MNRVQNQGTKFKNNPANRTPPPTGTPHNLNSFHNQRSTLLTLVSAAEHVHAAAHVDLLLLFLLDLLLGLGGVATSAAAAAATTTTTAAASTERRELALAGLDERVDVLNKETKRRGVGETTTATGIASHRNGWCHNKISRGSFTGHDPPDPRVRTGKFRKSPESGQVWTFSSSHV